MRDEANSMTARARNEIASFTSLINARLYGYILPSYHLSFHLPVARFREPLALWLGPTHKIATAADF